jgi:hypothetical protein
MTEPRRLFDEAGDDLTRQLLDAGRDGGGGPTAALQAKMWSGIEASLAPIAGGAAGGASGAASGGATSAGTSLSGATAQAAAPSAAAAATPGVGLAIGTKLGLVGLFVGATLVTATVVRPPGEKPAPATVVEQSSARIASPSSEARNGPAPTPDRAAPDRAAPDHAAPDAADARPIDPRGAEQSPDSKPEVAATKPSAKQTPQSSGSAAPKASTASSLVEEVAAVQKARAALAAGNATEALSVLAALDKTIPRGSLGQERVVLTIEALAASGQKGKAGQLAKAFLEANPSSPYADRVRPYAP